MQNTLKRTIKLNALLLVLVTHAYSQDKLYVANGSEIGYIDIANDTYTFLTKTPSLFLDIALTPQGKIYGFDITSQLYEIDPATWAFTVIPLTPLPALMTYFGINSMVSDRNGDLFIVGATKKLFKVDMKTGTVNFIGNTLAFASGDLCFSDGKLYMVGQNNDILEIILGPSGNSIISQRIIGRMNLKGLVYSIGCNENGICYVVSSTQELALVDLEDATTYVICNPIKGPINNSLGIAMQKESVNDKPIEICGNGTDDDNNGFTDDNDMACRLKRGTCTTSPQQIFKEDFGSGSGYGNALPNLSTAGYSFSTTAPLAEGYYTIVDNPQTAQGNATWKNMTDHSGLAGGRMLITNGSYTPGEFYRRKASGLCGGLQYSISVSAAAVESAATNCGTAVTAIPSRIRFLIEDVNGKILGQLPERYIPADNDPAAKWNDYGMVFTLPEGITDIQIVLVNDAPGGCGNDLAIDDIIFGTCNPLQTISINGTYNSPFTGCKNTDITLKVDIDGLELHQPVFQWQKLDAATALWVNIPNVNSPTYNIKGLQPADAGQYRVIISDMTASGCARQANSIVEELLVQDIAGFNILPEVKVCAGNPLQLDVSSTATLLSTIWTYPNGTQSREQHPLVTKTAAAADAGTYQLEANAGGCTSILSTQVTVMETAQPDFTLATAVCFGQPLQIQASSANTITGWQWNGTGDYEIIQANTASPVITWNAPGTYQLTLKATGECLKDQPVTHTITIQGLPVPGKLDFPAQVCVGMPLYPVIADYSGGIPNWNITGNPLIAGTDDKPVLTWNNAGTYTISYSIDGACGTAMLPAALPVIVKTPPSVTLGDDMVICKGAKVVLQPVYSKDAVSFSWQDELFVAESRYGVDKAGTYKVIVQDEWGCRNEDEITIQETNCSCAIYVPTAFSPNGDGVNDLFRPELHCITTKYSFRVYNRWGQLVFNSEIPGEGWNGRMPGGNDADVGSYVWVLEYQSYEFPDATIQKGAVTLVL